jgi:DNA-binding phage protein
MATTRPFSDSIHEDLQHPEYRRALLGEAIACMAAGDTQTGKSVLRHYINGTIGFVKLGADLQKSPKSLMRMLSSTGNPGVRGLFEIVAHLQKVDHIVLTVHAIAA